MIVQDTHTVSCHECSFLTLQGSQPYCKKWQRVILAGHMADVRDAEIAEHMLGDRIQISGCTGTKEDR